MDGVAFMIAETLFLRNFFDFFKKNACIFIFLCYIIDMFNEINFLVYFSKLIKIKGIEYERNKMGVEREC